MNISRTAARCLVSDSFSVTVKLAFVAADSSHARKCLNNYFNINGRFSFVITTKLKRLSISPLVAKNALETMAMALELIENSERVRLGFYVTHVSSGYRLCVC